MYVGIADCQLCITVKREESNAWQGTVCSFTVPFKVGVHMDDAECIGELPNHIKLWFYPDQKNHFRRTEV